MELTSSLTTQLKHLRLSGVLETLDARTRQAIDGRWSYVEFLSRLLEDEVERRGQKQLTLRVRKASLNTTKTLETFDFNFNPALNRQQSPRTRGRPAATISAASTTSCSAGRPAPEKHISRRLFLTRRAVRGSTCCSSTHTRCCNISTAAAPTARWNGGWPSTCAHTCSSWTISACDLSSHPRRRICTM